ncbi:helix-turn-helix domain containing protein [Sphingomonas sp. H160509]|uniref:TetR/AcrR family transcriptional regulator n=1 Tax=Sphingomonas sp. H160509 TaxID=2955313 RepID=UPI0021E88C0A|nr:helix-turn-helix domain containing protein [Sphingomonas sp. H160509]
MRKQDDREVATAHRRGNTEFEFPLVIRDRQSYRADRDGGDCRIHGKPPSFVDKIVHVISRFICLQANVGWLFRASWSIAPYILMRSNAPYDKPFMLDGTLTEREKTATSAEGTPKRRVRADAQRSEDAVLEAAKALFAEAGVDATVRQIADRAGVGMGTLYRRFPKRSDLIAAVFRREVDACAAEAATLATRYTPGEALERWLKRYAQFLGTKKGLAVALHSGDPAFDELPAYFRAHFEPALASLLDAAAATKEVRDDVEPYDLLRAIGNLGVATGEDGAAHAGRILNLLIDGLRHRQSHS